MPAHADRTAAFQRFSLSPPPNPVGRPPDVDAPLIVPNETGQRRCETEISRAFWRYKIGAHSSNRGRVEFDPLRAAILADQLGWSVDPAHHGSVEEPVCIEVYPHPAMVVLFDLTERIVYNKSGPARAAGFAQLVQHLGSIGELGLSEHARWAELTCMVADPKRGDLTRIEDELDAILCAHLAWLWHHRPESLQVYDSLQEGYIVAPPPHARREAPATDLSQPAVPPPTSPVAIAVDGGNGDIPSGRLHPSKDFLVGAGASGTNEACTAPRSPYSHCSSWYRRPASSW